MTNKKLMGFVKNALIKGTVKRKEFNERMDLTCHNCKKPETEIMEELIKKYIRDSLEPKLIKDIERLMGMVEKSIKLQVCRDFEEQCDRIKELVKELVTVKDFDKLEEKVKKLEGK